MTKFKVGDAVGVGCFIDACLDCVNCEKGDEQYCLKGMTGTYNGEKKHGRCGGKYLFLTCKSLSNVWFLSFFVFCFIGQSDQKIKNQL